MKYYRLTTRTGATIDSRQGIECPICKKQMNIKAGEIYPDDDGRIYLECPHCCTELNTRFTNITTIIE